MAIRRRVGFAAASGQHLGRRARRAHHDAARHRPAGAGLVSACWLESVDGIGMSVIILQTKEHAAQSAAYPFLSLPRVTPRMLEIREVYATA